MIATVLVLAATVHPNHAFFQAHVEAARARTATVEQIRVEPWIGPLRGPNGPIVAAATWQGERGFVLVYDPFWLAHTTERDARWIAYHEVCHVAMQQPYVKGELGGEVRPDLEREADMCANVMVGDRITGKMPRGKKCGLWKALLIGLVMF